MPLCPNKLQTLPCIQSATTGITLLFLIIKGEVESDKCTILKFDYIMTILCIIQHANLVVYIAIAIYLFCLRTDLPNNFCVFISTNHHKSETIVIQ